MACASSLKEEFLTCVICTDIYDDPCTLSCEHSFCRKCITKYIQTRPDCIQAKKIPCAYCRRATNVPNPTRPVKEWSGQFKPSLMLQGLMDRLHNKNRNEEGQGMCFACSEIGESSPASSWCSDCEIHLCKRCANMHVKVPVSQNHDVSGLSGGAVVKRKKIKCKEHKGEEMKFVCKDCNTSACQTCCILKHRKCEHVVAVESLTPEIQSDLGRMRRVVQDNIRKSNEFIQNEKSMVEKDEAMKLTKRSEIKSTFQNVFSLLKKKEKELLDKLDDVSEKQIVQHQANIKSGQITNQMYQQHLQFIDLALQSESEMEMYEMYQVCQSRAVESVEDTESYTRDAVTVSDVKFKTNMEPLRKAIQEMGQIDVMTDSSTPQNIHSQSIVTKAVFSETINSRYKDDKSKTSACDVTVLKIGNTETIVITDVINKCLKSVCKTGGRKQEVYSLRLSDRPLCVANLTKNTVVCTVYGCLVMVIAVRPKLVQISKLETTKQYYGITALSDSVIAVGSNSPSAVDVMNLNGQLLMSITPHDVSLLKNPEYLYTTNDGNILVSDHGTQSVYCLSPQGGVVFTSRLTGDTELRNPQGVTVTKFGTILVADFSSQKIIQLHSDGTFVNNILTTDGIGYPTGIFVEDNKLFACDGPLYGYKDVKVYTVT